MRSYNITLASASPRRRELIKKIKCINATAMEANVCEDVNYASVEETVMHLAKLKAEEVFKKTGGIVLGADTLVSKDGRIFSKPSSQTEAVDFFKMLCGATHEVTTGICFMSADKEITKFEKTYVTFNAFNEEIVYNYINSGKPFDKAGGYGIQDEEIKSLVKSVKGDLYNVIGLPLKLTEKTLKENF